MSGKKSLSLNLTGLEVEYVIVHSKRLFWHLYICPKEKSLIESVGCYCKFDSIRFEITKFAEGKVWEQNDNKWPNYLMGRPA